MKVQIRLEIIMTFHITLVIYRLIAKFAHEYVLLEINREFGQKIHVTPERRDIYRNIPEVFEIVTLDDNTKFHLCGNRVLT